MKSNFFQKAKNFTAGLSKKKLSIFLGLAIILISFSIANFAFANWAVNLLTDIVKAFFNLFFALLGLLIAAVIGLARYSGFTTAAAVVNGWVIVRDFCNLFFIIILLVIAFSTILRVGGYNIKSALPKLLIMAILINFSKTICGLIIDAAQIIMLSFLAPFKGISDWGFSSMFGVQELEKFSSNAIKPNPFNIFASYCLGLIMLIIAAIVLVVMICVLTMRIVMLWIYVVLSPLAYFLSTFPQGKKHADKWWSDFTENVIIGPVLAFFLWLAFASLGSSSRIAGLPNDVVAPEGLTEAFSFESLSRFAISIGMLIGGLMISQGLAGGVGKIAGAGMSKINAGAGWAKKKVTGAAMVGAGAVVGAGVAVGKTGGKAVLGAANRLGGLAIAGTASGVKKVFTGTGLKQDSKFRTTAMEGVSSLAMAGLRAPQRVFKSIKEKITGDRDLNRALHEHFMKVQAGDKDAKLNYRDQSWELNSATGEFVNNSGEVLRSKGLKGQKVKAMGSVGAALHQAFGAATSKSMAAADKAKEEKIEKFENNLKSMDAGQLQAIMRNSGKGDLERMAAAKILAEAGNLRNIKDAELAKKLASGLKPIFEKVEDAIDKKQAHLNYNLDNKNPNRAGEVNRLKKRIDKDKIDVTRLPKDAIGNLDFMEAVHDHRGKEFWNDIESAHKKGGQKVRAAIEDTMSKMAEKFNADSASTTDARVKNSLRADAVKAMTTRAGMSGNLEDSFVNKTTGAVDKRALQEFFNNAKPKEINKINSFDFNDFGAKHATEMHDLISSFSFAKLNSLYKNGENNDLVREIGRLMKGIGHRDVPSIDANKELSSLIK